MISVDKAAILPDNTPFVDGVVVPFALEAAICALSIKEPGTAFPGVPTPALNLPYPTLEDPTPSINKTIVIYGGSTSSGSMTTQIATNSGIKVVSIVGRKNFDFSKKCGAVEVFDYKDPDVVEKVIKAVTDLGGEFVGIFDTISTPATHVHDLAILERLGGGHLACTHFPPTDAPENVKGGMIFAVNDVAGPVWRDYVGPALEAGKIQCLPPPNVIGTGLQYIQEGLNTIKAGVSAAKLVIAL